MGGDGAEHQPLGVRSRDAEIRAGRRATFAGAYPIAGMRRSVVAGGCAGGSLEVGVRKFVLRPTRSRQQPDTFAAAAGSEIAFAADEYQVVSGRSRLASTAAS